MPNATTSQRINRTPGVVGGDACIRDTRIPVWTLIQLNKLGRGNDELVTDFPGLTDSDLTAAWQYYREHTAEIDAAITAEEAED
jgi:uncharacterized protein (DUF433 family)